MDVICGTCSEMLDSSLAYGNNRGVYLCRSCNTAAVARYRGTPKGKKAIYQANRRFIKRNPEKVRAWHIVRNARTSGILVRPDRCSSCGLVTTPQAHHKDYSRPLEVIWLCRVCHKNADRMLTLNLVLS